MTNIARVIVDESVGPKSELMRSYFGTEANIASAALTIGANVTGESCLCGYFLRLAGKSGVKGLQASEGYRNSANRSGK